MSKTKQRDSIIGGKKRTPSKQNLFSKQNLKIGDATSDNNIRSASGSIREEISMDYEGRSLDRDNSMNDKEQSITDMPIDLSQRLLNNNSELSQSVLPRAIKSGLSVNKAPSEENDKSFVLENSKNNMHEISVNKITERSNTGEN